MVSVQDQNTVHSTFQNRINFIRFARRGEHHIQEVTGIGEIVARVNKWLTNGILVTHRGHGRHFRQQAERGNFTMTRIVNIQRVVIERRQRAGNTTHDCHWMRVATESMEQTGNLFVDHGMTGHRSFKFVILFLSRFFTIQQDVTNFQVVRIGRQLIDRETAVQQNTFITINKSNFRFAGCG